MVKMVKTLRKDMFAWDGYDFKGEFSPDFQERALLTSLKALVSMLINGPSVLDREKQVFQASLTKAQLIKFIAKNNFKDISSPRHKKIENLLFHSIWVLPFIHRQKSKKIVNILHKLMVE